MLPVVILIWICWIIFTCRKHHSLRSSSAFQGRNYILTQTWMLFKRVNIQQFQIPIWIAQIPIIFMWIGIIGILHVSIKNICINTPFHPTNSNRWEMLKKYTQYGSKDSGVTPLGCHSCFPAPTWSHKVANYHNFKMAELYFKVFYFMSGKNKMILQYFAQQGKASISIGSKG